MSLESVTIVILIIAFVVVSCWALVLDTKVYQMKSYIDKLEREKWKSS